MVTEVPRAEYESEGAQRGKEAIERGLCDEAPLAIVHADERGVESVERYRCGQDPQGNREVVGVKRAGERGRE